MKDFAKWAATAFSLGFLTVLGIRTAEYVLPETPPKRMLICVERLDDRVKCYAPEEAPK